MALPVMRIKVDVADMAETQEVSVRHKDRLRAEVALQTFGSNAQTLPMHLTTAWTWAALKAAGIYDKPLAVFLEYDCLELEVVDADGEPVKEEAELPDVDPTHEEEPTGGPSRSPSTTPEPASPTG